MCVGVCWCVLVCAHFFTTRTTLAKEMVALRARELSTNQELRPTLHYAGQIMLALAGTGLVQY